jgi:hybrid cluster-associated redox disulfide protein
MNEQKITKNMLIGEIVKKHPKYTEIMTKHGMHCIGCHVATWETLEQGAQAHGIDIKKLIDDLNNSSQK